MQIKFKYRTLYFSNVTQTTTLYLYYISVCTTYYSLKINERKTGLASPNFHILRLRPNGWTSSALDFVEKGNYEPSLGLLANAKRPSFGYCKNLQYPCRTRDLFLFLVSPALVGRAECLHGVHFEQASPPSLQCDDRHGHGLRHFRPFTVECNFVPRRRNNLHDRLPLCLPVPGTSKRNKDLRRCRDAGMYAPAWTPAHPKSGNV